MSAIELGHRWGAIKVVESYAPFPHEAANVSVDSVVTGRRVELRPFVEQLHQLGREPPSETVHLAQPTVLVVHVQHRHNVVRAEAQFVGVLSREVLQRLGALCSHCGRLKAKNSNQIYWSNATALLGASNHVN